MYINNEFIHTESNCKYYIGTTEKDVVTRLEEHKNKGFRMDKKISSKKLIKSINNCDKYDEDKWTKFIWINMVLIM